MENILNGKLAVVTGAGRGIGRALATGLAASGARVVLVARSTEQLDDTAGTITAAGHEAHAITADLGDPDNLDRVLGALTRHGRVEILINNAATVAPLGPTLALDPQAFAAALNLNVIAPAMVAARLAPAMIASGWGRVVNISSGIVAHPASMIGGNIYATTKAALEAHTLNLAAELDGTGVTVNAYRPGSVDTAMQEWIRSQNPDEIGRALHDRFARNHTERKLITPDQSAATLLDRLTSTENGQIWDVAEPR